MFRERSVDAKRLGLRARSAIAFGFSGLILSTSLALFTYNRGKVYFLRQRESYAISQAVFNARQVFNAFQVDQSDPSRVMASAASTAGAQQLLWRDKQWFVTSANISPVFLPRELRDAALGGVATRQRYLFRGQVQFAVAIPLTVGEEFPTVYFETTTFSELSETLATLRATLVAGTGAAALLGALLGYVASRRVLRPLAGIADTAVVIGRGDLDARIQNTGDPDLSRLVESFNGMADSLKGRIDNERRLAAHVSHELRSPLTSLKGAMAIVETRTNGLPDSVSFGVQILAEEIDRFERLVLDLLEISTMEQSRIGAESSPREVRRLLELSLGHLALDDLPVFVEPSAATKEVWVEPRRFERVIANLVENARKHGGEPISIKVEVIGTSVVFHVDDSGGGVREAETDLIFERFTRGAEARHQAGAGLGLALVKEHVRLMDGAVSVTKSPEGGARFSVVLRSEAGVSE